MVGREVIDIDISPPRPTTKQNKILLKLWVHMRGNLSKLSKKIQVHSMSKQDLVFAFLNIKNMGQVV
jgi:hypothetical protein